MVHIKKIFKKKKKKEPKLSQTQTKEALYAFCTRYVQILLSENRGNRSRRSFCFKLVASEWTQIMVEKKEQTHFFLQQHHLQAQLVKGAGGLHTCHSTLSASTELSHVWSQTFGAKVWKPSESNTHVTIACVPPETDLFKRPNEPGGVMASEMFNSLKLKCETSWVLVPLFLKRNYMVKKCITQVINV